MKAELDQLVALQKTDISIRQLQAALDAIPQRRAEIEREFDQRAFEFTALETTRDEAREKRARLDAEMAQTRAHAEKAERDLMSSTNEKAYTAAIREVDAARKHISTLETQILEQMETSEQAEKDIGQHEPQIANLRAELEERLKGFDEQMRVQAENLATARAGRDRLLASLPKSLSALYNRISTRIRDGIAVAEARHGSCTACLMTLRPQVMAQVRRGDEVIICDNCNRILYYVPTEQSQTAPSVV